MTTTLYTAKVSATMVVECVCEKCNTLYSYKVIIVGDGSKNVSGLVSAADAEEVKRDAIEVAKRQINKRIEEKDYDATPCPNCEYIQSWQLESVKSSDAQGTAGCVFIAVALLLGIPYFLIYVNNKVLGAFQCVLGIAILAVGGLAAFIAYRIVKSKPKTQTRERVAQSNMPTISWEWDEHVKDWGDVFRNIQERSRPQDKSEEN